MYLSVDVERERVEKWEGKVIGLFGLGERWEENYSMRTFRSNFFGFLPF